MDKMYNNFLNDLKNQNVDLATIDKSTTQSFYKIYQSLKNEIKEKSSLVEKLQVILDTTPCTVSWITKDLQYEGVNETLAKTCNLKVEDFKNKRIGFYTQNLFFKNFAESLFTSDLLTLYQEVETTIAEVDKKYWVVGTKYNNNMNAVIIGVDVTELRHLEENIAFLDKLSSLGEMVASIVHEINNPLTSIKMRTRKVSKLVQQNDYNSIDKHLKLIDQTSLKIEKIIKGVKSFVRQGHKDPFTLINLFQLIDEAVIIVGGKIKEQDVKLIIEIDNQITFNINETQIFQIFVNLITNSIDAICDLDEKWIRIASDVDQDSCYIYFEDSGNGISNDIITKMFDSFFTTKGIGKGTGLGLALCKKIVKQHSGELYYQLSTKGHTQFVVKLPLALNNDC